MMTFELVQRRSSPKPALCPRVEMPRDRHCASGEMPKNRGVARLCGRSPDDGPRCYINGVLKTARVVAHRLTGARGMEKPPLTAIAQLMGRAGSDRDTLSP